AAPEPAEPAQVPAEPAEDAAGVDEPGHRVVARERVRPFAQRERAPHLARDLAPRRALARREAQVLLEPEEVEPPVAAGNPGPERRGKVALPLHQHLV